MDPEEEFCHDSVQNSHATSSLPLEGDKNSLQTSFPRLCNNPYSYNVAYRQIMTETSFVPTTHPTANLVPVATPPAHSPLPNGTQSHNEGEEEPYTIRCVCGYDDDDGNTVYCENCNTWQHIICYYHAQEVPEIHFCVHCETRFSIQIDSKAAAERQRRLREQDESGDRKQRRPGAKGQRKKVKDREQSNGWGLQDKPNRDLPPPAKKPRHRASASVSSLPDGRKRASSTTAAPAGQHKRSSSISSHHPLIPLYSNEFIHLYDNDHVNVDMQSNLFDTLGLAGDLASWVQDPVALAQVANGRAPKDVFTHSDQLEPSKWPPLTKQTMTDRTVEYNGRHPTWKFLKVRTSVRKDEIVGEVRGKVGHFRDYCLDPNSRWQELRHPEPFVFFHPQLPIYIDSRKEGTKLRYIRRSCRPNVTLRTFITNKVEYHFCFVATQDIPENTEITTTWYLDPQIFPSNLVKQEGSGEGIPDSAAISISNVLAHFGGCACDSSQPCMLAGVDLRRLSKVDTNLKQTNGKRKKTKSKPIISPANTGNASNSRAGSETAKHRDDEDTADVRSNSGSTRSNPHSRDLTPTGLIDGELSAREKRKIAAVEKKFEQLEQDQQQGQKRKKRNPSQVQNKANAAPKVPRLDTAISRRSSGSPSKPSPKTAISRSASRTKKSTSSTPRVSSPLGRPIYVDSAMQTDPDENDPDYIPPKPIKRQEFIPLTKRLLKRCLEDRLRLEELARVYQSSGPQTGPNGSSQTVSGQPASSQVNHGDVEMKDADTAMTPPKSASGMAANSNPPSSTQQPPLYSLPSTVAHNMSIPRKPPGELRVQLPPPQFVHPSSIPLSSSKMSPPSLLQTSSLLKVQDMPPPNSGIAAPSPVKKKLSFTDYKVMRKAMETPTKEKSPPHFPIMNQTPANSADGSSPPTVKSGESLKPTSPSTPDAAMKDVHMSGTASGDASPSLRDPRHRQSPT